MVQVPRYAELEGSGYRIPFTNTPTGTAIQNILTGLDGWYGGVGTKGDDTERTLDHGAFPSRNMRTGRALTLRATLIYESQHQREISSRDVSGILWSGELGMLTATMDGLELSTPVKLDGEIKVATNGLYALDIEVPLRAPSSWLFGAAREYPLHLAGYGEGLEYSWFSENGVLTYGNSVPSSYMAITNQGNARAYPEIVVQGFFPGGFRLTSGGLVVEYPDVVHPQSPVTVDMATGSVTLKGGQDRTHRLTHRQWWSIPARGVIQPRITGLDESDGYALVRVRDTYI